jgi:predicted DNA-binding protein
MHPPSAPPADEPRASTRMDARLDATTRQKVDELAQHFHRPRAAVLCHIMHWGLSHGQTGPLDQGESPGPVCHLYFYVASDLYGRVRNAAAAVRLKTAPWLRHMVRHITMADFPASWHEGQADERSHESRRYGKRFMLRLDGQTWATLDAWSTHFERSAAEIIRQLLAQATPDSFPASWHLRVAERHGVHARRVRRDADDEG